MSANQASIPKGYLKTWSASESVSSISDDFMEAEAAAFTGIWNDRTPIEGNIVGFPYALIRNSRSINGFWLKECMRSKVCLWIWLQYCFEKAFRWWWLLGQAAVQNLRRSSDIRECRIPGGRNTKRDMYIVFDGGEIRERATRWPNAGGAGP